MSQLSDYAENNLVDLIRAQTWTLGTSLYMALASAATDSAITELTGTGYARVALTRNLTNWAGTQGVGTTLASSGTTHGSSNNGTISWGTSGSAWGTANYVVVYDASTAGNVVAYLPLATAIVIGTSTAVSVAAGALNFTLGLTGGCSDYLCNKLIDFIFRGQAFTFPATMYCALLTATPSNAGGGTEVGGGVGYARVAIAGSLANWAGTQSAGSTTASTGTGGQTSNNAAITFAAPSGSWGTVGWAAYLDASSGGNLLFWAPLAATKSIPGGAAAPSFAAADQTITFA
jgi:hypothetical protein